MGRPAIREYWRSARESGTSALLISSEEVEAHGDTAVEIGHSTVLSAAGEPAGRFRYMVLWKRRGGAWQIHRELWNTTPSA